MGKSISMPQGRGSLKHNRRDYELGEWPDNIDQSQTDQNIILADEDLGNAYDRLFGQAVEEYNAKQKRKDRKITSYMNQIKKSGNGEKLFYEDVLQYGDKDLFKDNPELRETAKKALVAFIEGDKEKHIQSFEERNPGLNLIGAYIHMDEKSPHLHFDFIPTADGYKTGLKLRNSLSKAMEGVILHRTGKPFEMRATEVDSKGKCTDNQTKQWKELERALFRDICLSYGLEVDLEKKSRGSLSVEEYKAAKEEMQKEILEEVLAEKMDLEESVAVLQDKEVSLESSIEEKTAELEQKTAKEKALDANISTTQATIDTLNTKKSNIEADISILDNDLEERRTERRTLASEKYRIKQEISDLDTQKEEAEKQLKEKNDALEALSTSIQPLQTQVDELKKIKTDLEGDIEVLESQKDGLDVAIKNAMGQAKSEYNGIINEANEKAKTIKSDAKTKADEIIAEANETANSIIQSAFQNSDVQALQKENAKLKTENKWLRSLIEGFHHKVDCFYADHSKEPFFEVLSGIIANFNKEWNFGRGPVVRKQVQNQDQNPNLTSNLGH